MKTNLGLLTPGLPNSVGPTKSSLSVWLSWLVTEQRSKERFTKPNWNEWDARPVSDFQMRRDDSLVNEESQLFLGRFGLQLTQINADRKTVIPIFGFSFC